MACSALPERYLFEGALGEGGMGAVLLELLGGPPPYQQGTSLARTALRSAGLSTDLVEICAEALELEMSERFADAGALARTIGDWLEGVQRRQKALAVVEEARAAEDEAAALRQQAGDRWDDADTALDAEGVGSRAGWSAWEEAGRLRQAAELRALAAEQALVEVLAHAPARRVAHRARAGGLRGARDQATDVGDTAAAQEIRRRLNQRFSLLRSRLRAPEQPSRSAALEGALAWS